MDDKFAGFKEIRVMYVANESLLGTLKNDFIKRGASNDNKSKPNLFNVSSQMLQSLGLVESHFPGALISFYSDVHDLALDLPSFDAGIIIVDERQVLKEEIYEEQNSSFKNESHIKQKNEDINSLLYLENSFDNKSDNKETKTQINFNSLHSAIEKFTPPNFIYSMRKVVVILPKSARKTSREFDLKLANVRAVIVEPSDIFDLFIFAIKRIFAFNEKHKKTSICISGGGLEGYLYSLGVVNALDHCFLEKSCSDFDIFCGVSSGAIVASCLAAEVHSDELVQQINKQHLVLEPLKLSTVFDFAGGEVVKRLVGFVKAFSTLNLEEFILSMQQAVPIGFFRGEKLKKFIEVQMQHYGMEDNLSSLRKELYISATDQDTGENIVFGEEPWKDVKISQAIRASTALPPFYLPERINGHWFTDGQLTSSSDFKTAIRKGAGLVIYIDPMVPYTSNLPGAIMKRGGFFTILQAIKTLIHTRSGSMLKHSMDNNPDVDFVIFKPADDLMEAMAGNPMKYNIRTELVDLGYRCTLQQIISSYDVIAHKFAKYSIAIKSKSAISSLLT